MTPQRWSQIENIFVAVSPLAPAQRESLLAKQCGDDLELRREVEAMLASHDKAEKFIEAPAFVFGGEWLGEHAIEREEAGERLGPYELLHEIGEGGMGAVYLATRADDQYRKQVAVKLIKRGFDTEDMRRRFRHERQILASLDHPNIARLIDGGTTNDGRPYLVMDYVEGAPITRYGDEHELSIRERLAMFRTVCSAVHYAHQNLVIHRDLKPGNVLVTADGTPKLLDFGIAKLLDTEVAETSEHTVTMLGVMTPEYASPEQVCGEQVTTASDVYSLGVLLYELLSGHRPYRITSRRPDEIVRVICEVEPDKPSTAGRMHTADRRKGATHREGQPATEGQKSIQQSAIRNAKFLRGDLDNIVLMAMRKEPARRYASVEQFSEDVRRHLEGLPVIARKDTFVYRGTKFVNRHRFGVAAAALVVVSLFLGIVLSVREERKAQRRFNEVRKLANSVIFEFHDSIENLPGSTPARELLVKRALEYLDSLAREAGDDPSLQRDLIAAYLRIGNVQGNPNNANLGDPAGAMNSYRKALVIAGPLVAANPADMQARRSLALVDEKMSDLEDGAGDVTNAVQSAQGSLAIFKALAEADPKNATAQQSLAISYIKVGDFLGNPNFPNLGDQAGAMRNYQSSETIWQSSDPSTFKSRRFLGLVYERMGGILESQGNFAGALESYSKSLAIRERLAAENPTNTDVLRDMAIAQEKIGNAMTGTGNLAAALESRSKSLENFNRLAKADPQNLQAQRSLAISYDYMGDILGNPDAASLGRRAEARKSYQQALGILQSKETDPGNAETRRFLGHTEERIGAELASEGRIPEALTTYHNALQFLESLLASEPANPTTRRELEALYTKLGEANENLAGQKSSPIGEKTRLWNEARDWYRKAADMLLELSRRKSLLPTDVAQQNMLLAKVQECNHALEQTQNSVKGPDHQH